MDERAFGRYLVQDGAVTRQRMAQVQERQSVLGGRLDTVLLGTGVLSESRLQTALGGFFKARTVSGMELSTIYPTVARIISPRVARRFKIMPFKKDGNRLSVASMDPVDLLVEDELALMTGCMVNTFVALEVRLMECYGRFYGVELPAQMENLIRRLRGDFTDSPIWRMERPPARLPDSQPVPPKAEPRVRRQAPPARPASPSKPKKPEVNELEVDEEDLALFPSLRVATETEVDEQTAPFLGAPLPEPQTPPQPSPHVPAETPAAAAPVEAPRAEAEPESEELSLEERLAIAAESLQGAEMRDDIADALFRFCAPFLKRRMLLVVRKGRIVGWRGEGEGVDETSVRTISIPGGEASVFLGLSQGTSFWLGPLPPMPRNVDLVLGLGGDRPKECVILPVALKSKIVCFLYGDNLGDGVGGIPMGPMRRLISKASVAFQVYLLKSKIRLL